MLTVEGLEDGELIEKCYDKFCEGIFTRAELLNAMEMVSILSQSNYRITLNKEGEPDERQILGNTDKCKTTENFGRYQDQSATT